MSSARRVLEGSVEWVVPFLRVVSERFGQVIPERRYSTFKRAVVDAYLVSGSASLEEYLGRLASDPLESPFVSELVSRITIKESYFFRDESLMTLLRELVLPKLVARSASSRTLTIWSAGCSIGEEPYSIAILLDHILASAPGYHVRIVGTDVDDAALRAAVRGEYGDWSVRGVPPALLDRCFERRTAKLRLRDRYRRWVRFETHNLADTTCLPPEPGQFDLVLCRNVGIYLSDEAVVALYEKLEGALAQGGLVVTAPSDPRPTSSSMLTPVLLRSAAHTVLAYATTPAAWERPSLVARQSIATREPPPITSRAPAEIREESSPPPVTECRETPAEPRPTATEEAFSLADSGNVDRAIGVLVAAVAAAPLDPQQYFSLAVLELDRDNHDAAEKALRKALYLAPDFAEAHYRLGLLCTRRGDRVNGRRCLLTALRIVRDRGDAPSPWAAAIGAQLATMETSE